MRELPRTQPSDVAADSPPDSDALTGYFRAIATAPLLRPKEEVALARTLRDHTRAHHAELASIPLTAELAVHRWRAPRSRARGSAPQRSQAGHEDEPLEGERRFDAAMQRLERRLRAAHLERSEGQSLRALVQLGGWLRTTLLSADPAPSLWHEAYDRLSRLRRELDRVPRGEFLCFRAISREVGLPPRLFRERMNAVERSYRRRREAANVLVRHNLRLAVSVAKGFRGLGVPFDDLIQEANLGLLRAVERFDPERGYRLCTYAVWWIRQSLVRAVQNQSRTVRLPSHVNEKLFRYRGALATLSTRLGRDPTMNELSDELGWEPGSIEQLRQHSRTPLSLHHTPFPESNRTLEDFLEDRSSSSVHEGIDHERFLRELGPIIARLDAREQAVVRRRFALGQEESPTLQELASEIGVSRQRAGQIEQGALRKMRAGLSNQGWEYQNSINGPRCPVRPAGQQGVADPGRRRVK